MRNTAQTIRRRLFVGSSTESLDIAYAIQENLEHEFEVTVWSQGIFDLGTSALEALVSSLEDFDAAVFVFSPQDELKMRGKDVLSARDNVIFELGLFTGRLGRKRAFIVMPRGIEAFHLPTDLLGITPAMYDPGRADQNWNAALGPACNKIRHAILAATILSDDDREMGEDIPEDLKRSFAARRRTIGQTQDRILREIEDSTLEPDASVDLRTLCQRIGKQESETYYRLEQLRLLGFIVQIRRGEVIQYRLSPAYLREIGDAPPPAS